MRSPWFVILRPYGSGARPDRRPTRVAAPELKFRTLYLQDDCPDLVLPTEAVLSLTPVLRAKRGPVSRRLGSKDRAAPGHGKRGCGPRHKLRLWRLVPTRRRYRRGVDRGIGIIPAQKTATLHFGTMCFGTIGAGWVSVWMAGLGCTRLPVHPEPPAYTAPVSPPPTGAIAFDTMLADQGGRAQSPDDKSSPRKISRRTKAALAVRKAQGMKLRRPERQGHPESR